MELAWIHTLKRSDDSIAKNKHCNGHGMATEIEGNKRTPGKEIWREKCTAGFRYSWKKMEAVAQNRAGWKHGNKCSL